jgi:hypothetical protein
MKITFRLFAVIYRSFEVRGTDIPYFRSLLLVAILFATHIFTLKLLLDFPFSDISPWNTQGAEWKRLLVEILTFGATVTIAILIFSKKKLDEIAVLEGEIQQAKRILPIYIGISFAVLFILLTVYGKKIGKIHF